MTRLDRMRDSPTQRPDVIFEFVKAEIKAALETDSRRVAPDSAQKTIHPSMASPYGVRILLT
jgi:hypothetical protein